MGGYFACNHNPFGWNISFAEINYGINYSAFVTFLLLSEHNFYLCQIKFLYTFAKNFKKII